jgi:hypothetical protein
MHSIRIRHALLVIAAACIPALAGAQTVQGRVLEAGGSTPVPGAIVTVATPTGERAASTLSDSSGAYRVTAYGPGTYVLRVERVGYESSTSQPVQLQAGQTVEVQLTADPRRVRLDPVVATGEPRRCGGEVRGRSQAATLWDEARKALFSSTLAAESGRYRFATETRERRVSLRTRRVMSDDTTRHTSVGLPFRPMAADSLVEGAYVVITRRKVVVNGVDAYAILSDAFVRHHCFGVRDGGAERPGLVGLEFVPLASRTEPDVRGVLWMDRATAELRYVEYGYTGLRFRGPVDRLSGRMDFMRLPSGMWVVQNWTLTAPILRLEREPTRVLDMRRYQLWAVTERSGRILSVEAR